MSYNTDRAEEILCWNGRTCLGINSFFTDLTSLVEWLEGNYFWGRPTLSHAWGLLEAMWQNLKPFERKCCALLSCGLKRKRYVWHKLNTHQHLGNRNACCQLGQCGWSQMQANPSGEPVLVNTQSTFRVKMHFSPEQWPTSSSTSWWNDLKSKVGTHKRPSQIPDLIPTRNLWYDLKISVRWHVIWQKNLHRRMGKKPLITKKLAFLDTKYEMCCEERKNEVQQEQKHEKN